MRKCHLTNEILAGIKYRALKLQHVIFWLWWLARGVWPSSSSLRSYYSVRCLHLVHIKLNEEMDVLRIMGGASKSIPTDTTFFSLQFDFFKTLKSGQKSSKHRMHFSTSQDILTTVLFACILYFCFYWKEAWATH